MASKTGKLVLTGAMTAALAAGCQTQPLTTGASMGLGASADGNYAVLGNKSKDAPAAPSAPAAADEASCLEQNYAVFARSSSVNLHFTGARNVIEGDVHTNDELKMAGNNDIITGTGEAVDGFFIKGKSNTIANPTSSAVEDYPLTIDPDALGEATFSFTGDVNLNDRPEVWAAHGVLKDGIYRASGKIVVSTNGVKGKVTLIGSSIQLPGKQHDLEAYAGGVLGYATGAGANAIHLAGNSNTYRGLFAAPNGEFQMTGHQNELSGMVLADTFKLAGSNNTIRFSAEGLCPPPGSPVETLPPSTEPAPTAEPTPSAEPTPTPTPSSTPTPTPTPTATPPAEPTASPDPQPTAGASATPTAQPTTTITPPPPGTPVFD